MLIARPLYIYIYICRNRPSVAPREGQVVVRDVSPIEAQNCGIALQPSQSRHPRYIYFEENYLETGGIFFLLIIYKFCNHHICIDKFYIVHRVLLIDLMSNLFFTILT